MNITFWNEIMSISGGYKHSCGLLSNGSIMCWGLNTDGQIGDGTTTSPRKNPVFVNTTESFVSIAGGIYHTCGLLSNGSMMCWGRNSNGQIGDGTTTTPRKNPVFVNTTESFVSITAGSYHTCGLLSNGSMMCWGYNNYGQIGDGTENEDRLNPVFVNSTESFVSITAGNAHTCGLLSNGSMMCWGRNNYGQIGNGSASADVLNPVFVNSTDSFVSITGGDYHNCGLLENGSMMCWGRNTDGQIGNGSAGGNALNPVFVNTTESFVSITGGESHTCSLLSNGSSMCWGRNDEGQIGDGTNGTDRLNPVFVNTTESFVSITGVGQHTCGLLSNGSSMCWGYNSDGQIGDGTSGSPANDRLNPVFVNTTETMESRFVVIGNATDVASGSEATTTWSNLDQGRTYLWSTTVSDGGLIRNSPIWKFTTDILYSPNQPTLNYPANESTDIELSPVLNITVTDPDNDTLNVTFWNQIKSIVGGYYHTCGLLSNGSVMCWGRNNFGQIGDGTNTQRKNPVFVNTTESFVSITTGDYHTCGILSNGSAMCWGRNNFGQIGNGSSKFPNR